jgi:hypothetical protein
MGPHLHFGLSDKPDFFAGRSLLFVFDRFTIVGAVNFDTSEGDRVVMYRISREVRLAYPPTAASRITPSTRQGCRRDPPAYPTASSRAGTVCTASNPSNTGWPLNSGFP